MTKEVQEFHQQIKDVLYAKRKELGITQEQVADYLGMSRVNVVNMESGEQHIQTHHLWNWCNLLQLKRNPIADPLKMFQDLRNHPSSKVLLDS